MDGADDSPARGLKGILSKARRSREDSIPEETEVGGGAARDSSDNLRDKLRSRLGSLDEDRDQSDDKLLKLIPGHSKRKEKRRRKALQAEEGDEATGTEASRGRSLGGTELPAASGSRSTLDTPIDDDGSSIMTSASELEESSRPPLVDRKSHVGYLTSSSPQIRATTVDISDVKSSKTPLSDPPLSAATTIPLSGSSTATDTNLASQNDLLVNQTSAGSSLSIDSEGSGKSSKSRGVSPGSKIKDVFKPSRRETAPPSPNPDRPLSSTSLSNIFSKDKSGGSAPKSPRNVESPSQDGMFRKNKSATQSNKSIPSIITTPDTPPPLPSAGLGAPETMLTPPTPVDPETQKTQDQPKSPQEKKHQTSTSISSNPNVTVSPSGNMISHRRARSDSANPQPSKLSQSMTAPLTPTMEEVTKTPGMRNASQSSTGFFTSMFSAAQNAANTITNIGNNSPGRPRSTTGHSGGSNEDKDSKPILEGAESTEEAEPELTKPLAIDTIGSGDLSLSHLGIASDAQSMTSGSPSSHKDNREGYTDRSRSGTVVHREEASAREEDLSAARAVSAAYSLNPDDSVTPMVEDVSSAPMPAPNPRAGSMYEGSIAGERTPPTSVYEGEDKGLFRSGSLRSKVGRAKNRRNRNNSSSNTIGAAISATNSALVDPKNASNPKMTGFAVATKKRNRDFHQLFRSVPEDDYLIEDYGCALQKDILVSGRIYISEGHICFSANILGWVTTLVISFDEIVCVEKETTAMIFPNAIAIQTLHARHTFRSLINRDATYDLMIKIWKISHPSLQSSENGVNVATGTGSKTEKIESAGSDLGSPGSDEGEVYDEDDESGSDDEDDASDPGTAPGSITESLIPESPPKPAIARKPSNLGNAAGQATNPGPTVSDGKAAERAVAVASATTDFSGPTTHAPTECSDQSTHYEKVLKDETIPAPLGKIFAMVFGTTSGGFMSRWLMDDQKCFDLQMEDDKKGLSEDCKTRTYTYIKPLGGSIGPKQTKCNISEQLDSFDLEKAVSVTITTQTPDVPSGNVFSVKTRYCLMWGPNSSTRMIMCCAIEWTGKSWLKGPIEKGANDGQIQYANDLFKALRNGVASKPRATLNGSSKPKRSKKKKSSDPAKSPDASPAAAKAASWGPLEPLRTVFEPVGSLLGPLVSGYAVGVLVLVGAVVWWRRSGAAGGGVGGVGGAGGYGYVPQMGGAQRAAAYEEIWRHEERALWEWLEERIGGQEGIVVPGTRPGGDGKEKAKGVAGESRSNADLSKEAKKAREEVVRGKGGGLSEVEVRKAIEVTEERLRVLKEAVGGREEL